MSSSSPALHDSNPRLGPFFFTFRPTPGGNPVTVPGFFLPLQWPPPPGAANTDLRAALSFVYTQLTTEGDETPQPVWAGGNIHGPPPSQQPRPPPHTLLAPPPTPAPSSPFLTPTPGPAPTKAWNTDDGGLTVHYNSFTGQTTVRIPRALSPAPFSDPTEPSSGSTNPASMNRSTQNLTPSIADAVTDKGKGKSTAVQPDPRPSSPQSTKTRHPIPSNWMQPKRDSGSSGNASQVEASQVDRQLGDSVRSSDESPRKRIPDITWGNISAGGDASASTSPKMTPHRSLRRLGTTFYRSKAPTPPTRSATPNPELPPRPSTWSSSQKATDTPEASPPGLLSILGIKKWRKSSSRLRNITNLYNAEPGGSDSPTISERVMYPRRPMSSTPHGSAGPSSLFEGALEAEDDHEEEHPIEPIQPANAPFHVRNASGASIPSIESIETIPTFEIISTAEIIDERPPRIATLGRSELVRINNQLERTLAHKVTEPDLRTFDDDNSAFESPPQPIADMSATTAAHGGVFHYDLALRPQSSRITPDKTVLTAQSESSPSSVDLDSPSPNRSYSRSTELSSLPPLHNSPHIFDLDHEFTYRATRVPPGYVNADDVTLSPPKHGSTPPVNMWNSDNSADDDEQGQEQESEFGGSEVDGIAPDEEPAPRFPSISQEAYLANCTRTDLLQLFAKDNFATHDHAWADWADGSSPKTPAHRLNVSQKSKAAPQASEPLHSDDSPGHSPDSADSADSANSANSANCADSADSNTAQLGSSSSDSPEESSGDHSNGWRTADEDSSEPSFGTDAHPSAILRPKTPTPDHTLNPDGPEFPYPSTDDSLEDDSDGFDFDASLSELLRDWSRLEGAERLDSHRWNDEGLSTIVEDDEAATHLPNSDASARPESSLERNTLHDHSLSTSGSSTARPSDVSGISEL